MVGVMSATSVRRGSGKLQPGRTVNRATRREQLLTAAPGLTAYGAMNTDGLPWCLADLLRVIQGEPRSNKR